MGQRDTRGRKIKKAVPALTLVMAGLASGMLLSDDEIFACPKENLSVSEVYRVAREADTGKISNGLWGDLNVNSNDGEESQSEDPEEDTQEVSLVVISTATPTPTDTSDGSTTTSSTSSGTSNGENGGTSQSYSINPIDDISWMPNSTKHNDANKINTTTPEKKFEHMDENYKSIVKGLFSSKYFDKKMNSGYDSGCRGGDQEYGTVYHLYNKIEMRKAIEERFGISNVYGGTEQATKQVVGIQASPMTVVLDMNDVMASALTNSEHRAFLTKLAVENGITTANDPYAPEACLAVYYVILNNDLSSVNLKYSKNCKLTREQYSVLIGKYTMGWSALDFCSDETPGAIGCKYNDGTNKGSKFNRFYYQYRNCKTFKYLTFAADMRGLLSNVGTYKQMRGKVTKLEVICTVAQCYASQDTTGMKGQFNSAQSNYMPISDTYIKRVIKKYHISKTPVKYLKAAKSVEYDDRAKNLFKKSKQFDYYELQMIARCDKMGLIKPDKNGKFNWYGTVTEGQALRMLTQGAIKCKTHFAPYNAE